MKNIILLGATGYTGKLTLAALIERGIRPIIAGRNQDKLDALSAQFGGLDIRIANTDDTDSVKSILQEGDILLTTVGPFMQYGTAALEAAIAKKAHYLDSTGEPSFIQHVVENYGQRAKKAGVTFLPAAAYDYVPGQTAAALALEIAGNAATRVDVGYYGVGETPVKLSGGTLESIVHIMTETAQFWRSGRLETDYGGTRLRHFYIAGKKRPAVSVSTSEPFFLPKSYPQLRDINVYLGWFGAASYLLQQTARFNKLALRVPGARALFKKLQPYIFQSKGQGPNQAERDVLPSQICAIAYNDDDEELSSVLLEGANGYTFTADILAWTAHQLAEGKQQSTGVIGPLEAFGVQSVLKGCNESGLFITPEVEKNYGYR